MINRTIRRNGPITFDHFMELALYGDDGFFTRGGGAGRAGRDFLTSVEVGSLFGAMVAHAIDREWRLLGEPDPFVVIEVGAGNGRLARDVERALPECSAALRYLLVERSPSLRTEQRERIAMVDATLFLGPFHLEDSEDPDDVAIPIRGTGPHFAQLSELPGLRFDGVVFANELLDNLAFGVAVFDGSCWNEIRVGLDSEDHLCEEVTPLQGSDDFPSDVLAGTRIPIDRTMTEWIGEASRCLRRGAIILVDYVVPLAEIVARSPEWLRTFAAHQRGGDPLSTPGRRDITADVVLEHVERAARRNGLVIESAVSQRDWLVELGIEQRVAVAAATWSERAALGDLQALQARSVCHEAEALMDDAGLGGFRVMRLVI